MATDVDISLGYKDSAWFAANPTIVLKSGQHVYLSDGADEFIYAYVIGDGVTTLDTLAWRGLLQTTLTSPDTFTSLSVADGLISIASSDGIDTSGVNVRPDAIELLESTISVSTPLMVNASKAIKSLTDTVWGTFIAALTSKTTPIDADSIEISDSAASDTAKKVSLTNFKAFLKTYFDGLYLSLTGGALSGLLKQAKSTDIAGGTTIDLNTATGNEVHVTGSGWTCTSFGTVTAGTQFIVIFDGTGVLTYNATSLRIPGQANINVLAGDRALIVSEGSGNVEVVFYQSYNNTIGTWSPSHTGYSVNPSGGTTEYSLVGDICTVWMQQALGTGSGTACTVTLPFAAKYSGSFITNVFNNANTAGLIQVTAGSNIATGFATTAGGNWTNATSRRIVLWGYSYRIA